MLRAAIFDMDGLLIDSEPLWRRTQVEVLRTVGLSLDEASCEATTGLRIDEVVAYWLSRSAMPGANCRELSELIVDRMVERVRADGTALPGCEQAMAACARAGLRLALASSSHERLIRATLERLGLATRFELVVSAEDERFGKPHPAVLLTTAARLGVAPTECLVLEDSVNGVLAAKAARALCVAVPAPVDRADRRFSIADRVLDSLARVDDALLAELARGAPPREVRHALTILAADAIEPLVTFYRRAFGWPVSVETPVYVELALPAGQRLGVYQRDGFGRNTGQVPARLAAGELAATELYFYADHLEELVLALRALGARELSAAAPRPWGDEVAYFADPAGNVVALARPLPAALGPERAP